MLIIVVPLVFETIAMSLSTGPFLLTSFLPPTFVIVVSLSVPSPVGLLPWLSDIIF